MFAFLLYSIIGLYVLALIVSELRGLTINTTLELQSFKDRIKKAHPALEWTIPIGLAMLFVYNIFASAFWIIRLFVSLIVRLLSLVIHEFILPGPWLILRVLFHYLVQRPWMLIRTSFTQFRLNFALRLLKPALISMFIALVLNHFGQTALSIYPDQSWITVIASVLGFTAIGLGINKIHHTLSNESVPFFSPRTIIYILGLVAIWFGFWGLQLALFALTSLTTWSETLIGIFYGGGMTISALIMVNSIVLLFALAMVPTLRKSGPFNSGELINDVARGIYRRGWNLVWLLPSSILAMILATLLPYLVMGGINHVTKGVQQRQLENQVNQLNTRLDSLSKAVSPEAWMSLKSEELHSQFELDREQTEVKLQLQTLSQSEQLTSAISTSVESELGFFPATSIFFAYEQFSKIFGYSHIPNYSSESEFTMLFKKQDEKHAYAKQVSQEYKQRKQRAEAVKQQVCYPNGSSPNSIQADTTTTITYSGKDNVIDPCQMADETLRKSARDFNQSKQIANHELQVLNIIDDHVKSRRNGSNLGYFFAGLWASLIIGLTFSPALVLLARLIHFINTHEETGFYLVDSIELENQKNKNQPTFALICLFGIVLIFLSSSWGMFERIANDLPSAESIDNYQIEAESSLDLMDVLPEFNLYNSIDNPTSDTNFSSPSSTESVEVSPYAEDVSSPATEENSTEWVERGTVNKPLSKNLIKCNDGSPLDPAWIQDGECDCPSCEDEG